MAPHQHHAPPRTSTSDRTDTQRTSPWDGRVDGTQHATRARACRGPLPKLPFEKPNPDQKHAGCQHLTRSIAHCHIPHCQRIDRAVRVAAVEVSCPEPDPVLDRPSQTAHLAEVFDVTCPRGPKCSFAPLGTSTRDLSLEKRAIQPLSQLSIVLRQKRDAVLRI